MAGSYLDVLPKIAAVVVVTSWCGAETPSPRSAALMDKLDDEIAKALAGREGVKEMFDRYQSYANGRLDASAGEKTWADKTGNCRLGWYDHLMRNHLQAPREAEEFTRSLHEAVQGDHRGLDRVLATAAVKLDLTQHKLRKFKPINAPDEAIAVVKRALAQARAAHQAAFATLDTKERAELASRIYPATTAAVKKSGASFPNRSKARGLCDLVEKLDREALHRAANALVPLADPNLLAALGRLDAKSATTRETVTGKVSELIETPAGEIVIGGREDNTYDLDLLRNVCAVIDPGGNDTYIEGTVGIERPVLIIIDLAGDDAYRGEKPGIQGGAVCGVSMLIDLAGNDTYEARDVAQGACLVGVGMLVDYAGGDSYRGLRRAQGSAFGGVGVLIDRGGNDNYHAALYAQGFGGPLGFGLLDDLAGEDHYYAGGLYLDGYGDTPGYAGWSQGVGAGPRGIANGGIGVLLDGGGDDVYECDYFSHGGGYWFALGFARDFDGNDKRLGATRLGYDGRPRKEKTFLRWGIGFGCHYAHGFVFDDEGDDYYGGNIVGLGFAWDIGIGGVFDFGGKDHFTYANVSQAMASQAGMAILYDVGGDDRYAGSTQGRAPEKVKYHPQPQCGGNFGFFIDYLGTDTYGGKTVKNNTYEQSGGPGGFFIDREQVPVR